MNPRSYYESLIAGIPTGTERAVLSIMRFHVGLAQAIGKEELMEALKKTGYHLKNERQVREAIENLRRQGIPLCSSSTESGYFLASSGEEFAEFANREYWRKIGTMTETVRSMQDSAKQLFDSVEPGRQLTLI